MARRRGKGSRQPSAGDEVPYEHLTPDVIIGATESFGLDLRNASTGKLIPVQLIHHVEFDAEGQPSPSRTIVVPRHLAGTSAAGGEISAPRLSRFINNAPIGIAEIDKDGMVRMANGAFLELSPNARRGSELSAAIVAAERASLLQTLSAALREIGRAHV